MNNGCPFECQGFGSFMHDIYAYFMNENDIGLCQENFVENEDNGQYELLITEIGL